VRAQYSSSSSKPSVAPDAKNSRRRSSRSSTSAELLLAIDRELLDLASTLSDSSPHLGQALLVLDPDDDGRAK